MQYTHYELLNMSFPIEKLRFSIVKLEFISKLHNGDKIDETLKKNRIS